MERTSSLAMAMQSVCHKTFQSSPNIFVSISRFSCDSNLWALFLARHSVWTLFFIFFLYSSFVRFQVLFFVFGFFVSCCCNAVVAFINPAFVKYFLFVFAVSGLCDGAQHHTNTNDRLTRFNAFFRLFSLVSDEIIQFDFFLLSFSFFLDIRYFFFHCTLQSAFYVRLCAISCDCRTFILPTVYTSIDVNLQPIAINCNNEMQRLVDLLHY